MDQELPEEVLDMYAEQMETTYNGVYAEISIEHQDAVLTLLSAAGYVVTEDGRLSELADRGY